LHKPLICKKKIHLIIYRLAKEEKDWHEYFGELDQQIQDAERYEVILM
jgi:hypothetical protein